MEIAPPLQQSPDFAAALSAIGHPPLCRDGVVLMRRKLLGLPVHMASRLTLNSAPHLPGTWPRTPLILSPDHPAPWLFSAGAWPLMTPATVAEIDLGASPDQLLANQHQKWRNRLRHALKQGLHVRHGPMKNDINHWLYHAEIASQKQNGYRNYPIPLIHAFTRLGPGHSRLFTARRKDDIVAAMLFLRHGGGASYIIGHGTPRGRRLSAHTLLLWQAMLWLRRQGHSRLDLGTIDTRHAPGLARFKLGSGARAKVLGGTWLLLPGLAPAARLVARWDRPLFPDCPPTLP